MSLSQSKELMRVLTNARAKADRDGKGRVDCVLSNQDVRHIKLKNNSVTNIKKIQYLAIN